MVPGVKDSKVPVKRSRGKGREGRQSQTKGLCVSQEVVLLLYLKLWELLKRGTGG